MTNVKSTGNLIPLISEAISQAQKGQVEFKELFSDCTISMGKNEFLFFIKPEITVQSSAIQLDKILELICGKIEAFDFNIHNIKILSANYLEQNNIIAQHYGVINKIALNAKENLSNSAIEKFQQVFDKKIEEVVLLGGVEFIDHYPNFNAYSLDYLWQNVENIKLAGGTYCEKIKVDDEIIYLVNGFHPRQLKHFTESGRSIIVMTLSSNMSWKDARNNFIGVTNPEKASRGSLRREFLENKQDLGLVEVSQGVNGVHLSAGPVEALIELKRYNSNFSIPNSTCKFSDFSFGKILLENFDSKFESIINNINVEVKGKPISIFDLTEEKDTDEALKLLKDYIH